MTIQMGDSFLPLPLKIISFLTTFFFQVKIPEKAIAKAKSLGQEPDVFYAFQMLEQSGMCVVPGSGFGQKPGTYHFRYNIRHFI